MSDVKEQRVGDQVRVKHKDMVPYHGYLGKVITITLDVPFPIEVQLDKVDIPVLYTEAELRTIS